MDEARRTLLAELQEVSLEDAIERLVELGVLDDATLRAIRDEQLRDWRGRSLEHLGDELEALRRQARQQRRYAAEQVAEAHRERRLAGATRQTIVKLDEHRRATARRHARARDELSGGMAGLEDAHRSLGAALAALALLRERERSRPEGDMRGGLTVEEQRIGPRLALRVEGEIDIATAPKLKDALAAAIASGAAEISIDLGGVRFIDSTGMWALLRASQEMQGSRRLAVICPAGPARRALELTGIARMLAVYSDGPSANADG